jgi:hypothetical protein
MESMYSRNLRNLTIAFWAVKMVCYGPKMRSFGIRIFEYQPSSLIRPGAGALLMKRLSVIGKAKKDA